MLLTVGLTPAIQQVMVFDRYVPGEVNRAKETHTCAAGKAVNAARAAKIFEQDCPVATIRPRAAGEQEHSFSGLLRSYGLGSPTAPNAVGRTQGQLMRTCVTVIDRSIRAVTELVEESDKVDSEGIAEVLELVAAAKADTVVAAGSLSPGAGDDFYASAIASLPQAKWIIDAKGAPLLAALASHGGKQRIAKLNAEELAQSTRTKDVSRGIQALHDSGATSVIVTDGSKQVYASDGDRIERFTPPRVNVLNTTGCGDCLAGVFAMSLERGEDFFAAVRLGIAASAASAETVLPSVFDPARMKELARTLPA